MGGGLSVYMAGSITRPQLEGAQPGARGVIRYIRTTAKVPGGRTRMDRPGPADEEPASSGYHPESGMGVSRAWQLRHRYGRHQHLPIKSAVDARHGERVMLGTILLIS